MAVLASIINSIIKIAIIAFTIAISESLYPLQEVMQAEESFSTLH